LERGKRDVHSSGSSRYTPLTENVNGHKHRFLQSRPPSTDKHYDDIYALMDTPLPTNGVSPSPARGQRVGDSTSTPNLKRGKRKAVDTIQDGDPEEVTTASGQLVSTARRDPPSRGRQEHSQRSEWTILDSQGESVFGSQDFPANRSLSREEEFDNIIYGQQGAAQPPRGRWPVEQTSIPRKNHDPPTDPLQQAASCLYIHMDPRVHWTHNRSEEWHRAKRDEMAYRGTRKDSVGKAAARMGAKRLRRDLMRRAMPSYEAANGAESRDSGRHIDFGDVPEADLPDMVKANPEWLKAAAWMRECRQASVERQRDADKRRNPALSWDAHLSARGLG
jgi:hypothetical protein